MKSYKIETIDLYIVRCIQGMANTRPGIEPFPPQLALHPDY